MATRGIGFGVSSLLQGSCRYCKVWNLFYAFVSFGDAYLHSKLLWLDLITFRIPSCEAARCYTRLLNLKLTWYSTLFNPTFRHISMLNIPFICFVINICKILNLILYGDSYISLVLIIMVIKLISLMALIARRLLNLNLFSGNQAKLHNNMWSFRFLTLIMFLS